MDIEIAQYIFDNFDTKLPIEERVAIAYLKNAFTTPGFPPIATYEVTIKKLDWLDAKEGSLQVLVRGYEDFVIRTAHHIKHTSKDIFYNKCPKCDKLARTPRAKQCRYCYHNWHNL